MDWEILEAAKVAGSPSTLRICSEKEKFLLFQKKHLQQTNSTWICFLGKIEAYLITKEIGEQLHLTMQKNNKILTEIAINKVMPFIRVCNRIQFLRSELFTSLQINDFCKINLIFFEVRSFAQSYSHSKEFLIWVGSYFLSISSSQSLFVFIIAKVWFHCTSGIFSLSDANITKIQ